MDEIARIRAEYAARKETLPADLYAWNRKEIQYWQAKTAQACKRLLSDAGAFPLKGKSVADIGCGTGQWLREFIDWGAREEEVYGIDLLEERVALARQRLPQAHMQSGDASKLPWDNHSFDLVSQFTVFSSILDWEMRQNIASEMVRVLRPGGHILWYDCRYSNPANRAVRGVKRADIRRLFPNCSIRFARTTLLPPLSRIVARYSWTVAAALEALPCTRTHLVAVIEPR